MASGSVRASHSASVMASALRRPCGSSGRAGAAPPFAGLPEHLADRPCRPSGNLPARHPLVFAGLPAARSAPLPRALPPPGVPELDLAGFPVPPTGRGEIAAVRAEGHAGDRPVVPAEREHLLPAQYVPDPHGVIRAG